ncbi:MAG: amino acid permease, partial [Leptospiraceae bacterium]|nr:amino acid permease [Leptospiraceae bacterium]
NVAEETINPQKNILIGFGSAIASLVFLAILTFIAAVGVSGWEDIVFEKPGSLPSDSPLPLALGKVVGKSHFLYHMLVSIGLFGLLASFHGIILAAGRATYELGKENFAPPFLGLIHSRFHTPARALLVNMIFGILALFTGKTAEIITLACFGALSLYITSCLSLLQLRKQKPELERPFQVPFYPYFPFIALSIAIVSLLAMVYYNVFLFIIYLMIHLFFYSLYRYFSTRKANENT